MINLDKLKDVANKMGITVENTENKNEAGLYYTNNNTDSIRFNGLELLQIQKEKDK